MEGDDVVAERRLRVARGEPLAEADHPLALVAVHRLVALPGGEALPRLHLGDDERAAAADDEVDLARARAEVPLDDAVSAEAIEPGGAPLAPRAELARRDPPGGEQCLEPSHGGVESSRDRAAGRPFLPGVEGRHFR